MADIILFRPQITKLSQMKSFPQLPLGLLFIAGPLIQNNYTVKIIDEEMTPDWLDILDSELNCSTICVGISSMTGRQILSGLNFARIVKERFDIPVIWGGLHASMLPEQTAENNLVDIAVRGEGEEIFLKIVNALRRTEPLNNLSNVWWKKNGKVYSNPQDKFVDINALGHLPYHLVDCDKYIRIKRDHFPKCKTVINLYTDRGCPHRCGFCYNLNVNKQRWRHLSAEKVLEQIEYLVDTFDVDGIDFIADNFFVDKKRIVDMCNEIIRRKVRINWHADCRIEYFARYDDDFINLLKDSGCRSLTFGVESGSERVLGLINKDIRLEDVFRVNAKLKKQQIWVGYHFMAGFPGETKQDIRKTYEIMLQLRDEYPGANFLGPSIYTPYPGTPLYDKCIGMGFKPPEKLEDWVNFDWYENPRLPFEGADYSKGWLMQGVKIARRGTFHIQGFCFLAAWYRFRTRIIVKFNIIGPQPEEWLINFIYFLKKINKIMNRFIKRGGKS